MHTKLKIIGCGGHAKVVIDALSLLKHSYQISLCDGNAKLLNTEIAGLIVDSTMDSLSEFIGFFHVTIGDNAARKRVSSLLNIQSVPLTIIHSKAVIAQSSMIDEGSFIAALALVGPDSSVGKGCIINHGAIVDHDVKIGCYSHIAPHSTLGGNVRVGEGVLIGAGAVVLPGISIGDGAIIAAGAVVVKDVASYTTVKGVPAVSKE